MKGGAMKAIETAIKMEIDSIAFYKEAAAKTVHPFGKKMFLSFVEDEKHHLCALRDFFRDRNIEYESREPLQNVHTIFTDLRTEMMDHIGPTTDEVEAIKIALNMEKEGVHYYERAALEAADEREKALFQNLAREEEQHYRILENTDLYLEDTGNWFMWKEYSIVEGG